MSDQLKLGALLSGGEQRDAIHIAVAPVVANEWLRPGDFIAFVPGSTEHVGRYGRTKAIGIVDPFLSVDVEPGERFWMFLLPNTITSLRHDWTHPHAAFAAPEPPAPSKPADDDYSDDDYSCPC